MRIKAYAINQKKYVPRRQFLSGFHDGYDLKTTFHIRLDLGQQSFVSSREYPSLDHALAAGKRLANKLSVALKEAS